MESGACAICNRELGSDSVKVSTIGLATLVSASEIREDGLGVVFRKQSQENNLLVHADCRKNYTRNTTLKKILNENKKAQGDIEAEANARMLRSKKSPGFNFKLHCFICGEVANEDVERKKRVDQRRDVHLCAELPRIHAIRAMAQQRGDELGKLVQCRLANATDMVATDARYHHDCYIRFAKIPSRQPVGRPPDKLKEEAFEKVCALMEESDECQYSLGELADLMQSFLPDDVEGYSRKYIRAKLSDHFGDQVRFTDLPGQNCIVCFRETADRLIHEMWQKGRIEDRDDERIMLVRTAAKILREEIQSVAYDLDTYTDDGSDISNQERTPELLRTFIDVLTASKKQSAIMTRRRQSLCDLIVAACRPRSFLSPILLSLGVYLHRHYESRQLIDILHSLGFSASFGEVRKYEYSLMAAGEQQDVASPEGFVQFAFDNADVNIRNLDGHGTFHNMGGIMYETPKSDRHTTRKVPRVKKSPTAADIVSVSEELRGRMRIVPYEKPMNDGLAKIKIRDVDIESIRIKGSAAYPAFCVDTLWMTSFLLTESPLPNWNGFMQESAHGPYAVSSAKILPFIDRNPSDPTCIYSALIFAAEECRKRKQKACFVTFDQPLYAKASQIVASDGEDGLLSSVIVRLGGFHLTMSYLGSIGGIMEGSGLEEAWGTVYAKNSVSQMVIGHAYSRAVRAHLLTQLALCLMLLRKSALSEEQKQELQHLYNAMKSHEVTSQEVSTNRVVEYVVDELKRHCKSAEEENRTGALWVRYIEMVEVLRLYLRSERSGDWALHLLCIRRMIPIFHAAGHLPYAKSARLYLQSMEDLPKRFEAEDLEKFLKEGYFTIRRSDKFWCGVSPDLGIEQDVMRPMKTTGGLVRGRGINDSTLTTWVSAIPKCVPICDTLESYCGIRSESTEQHVELRDSRQARDRQDLQKIGDWFESHPPFSPRPRDDLVSLSTGVIASDAVNCDRALDVGAKAMHDASGKDFSSLKLRRKDKVSSFSSMSRVVRVRDKTVEIRPEQFFHRIIFVCNAEDDKKMAFAHELAPQPPSLFEHGLMRKTAKSALAEALQQRCPCEAKFPPNTTHVLDGGHLLYSVMGWKRDSTYSDVCDMYVKHVLKRYGKASTVVFDGYESPTSTKSAEQRRRANLKSSACLDVRGNLPVTTTSAEFLSNYRNKAGFINLLIPALRAAGVTVLQAENDADVLVVTTALSLCSTQQPVAIVATDTDILAIAIARASNKDSLYVLMPGGSSTSPKVHDIAKLQNSLGRPLVNALLFAHAMTGCDTTSSMFGKGKKSSLLLLENSEELRTKVSIFNEATAKPDQVASAAEAFVIELYKSKKDRKLNFEDLNSFRYFCYCQAVGRQALSGKFDIASLPPTTDGARQHALRVFHQVQQWLGNPLPPAEWGWRQTPEGLHPITMTAFPAPAKLMHLISCKCKSTCVTGCVCRDAKMFCSPMCKHCVGVDCTNGTNNAGLNDSEAEDDVEEV